jgi:hypothetical protein
MAEPKKDKVGVGPHFNRFKRVSSPVRPKIKPASLSRARVRSFVQSPSGREDVERSQVTQIFKGPVGEARAEARRIIDEVQSGRYVRIVEGWKQLPDGQIQFTIRSLIRCRLRS